MMPTPERRTWLASKRTRRTLHGALLYLILTAVSLLFALPLIWMLSTSLKSLEQQGAWPPIWIPNPVIWRNYPDALAFLPLGRYTANTLFVAAMSILGTFLSCPIVAYAFARIRFPGREVLFVVLIATIMLPGAVRLIPTYLMYEKIGWLNTYLPLIVPVYFGSPFFIFLLRQYFRTIPEDLADAARVHGATELGILIGIFLPLAGPVLATMAIFSFQRNWNDFFGPLIYLNKEDMRTLAVGLYYFREYQNITNWGLMMAAATTMTVPVLVLFALFQRRFIRGVALTGIKG